LHESTAWRYPLVIVQHLRLQRLTFGLIALLAIGWAQTFGLHRGFMCDCGGVEHITQVDHYHGPHSTASHEHEHEDEDHSLPHHHDEDDGDTHELAAVVDCLVAKQQNDAAPHISAPLNLLGTLDLWETSRLALSGLRFAAEEPPQRCSQAHEWPRRLAQTIALRI